MSYHAADGHIMLTVSLINKYSQYMKWLRPPVQTTTALAPSSVSSECCCFALNVHVYKMWPLAPMRFMLVIKCNWRTLTQHSYWSDYLLCLLSVIWFIIWFCYISSEMSSQLTDDVRIYVTPNVEGLLEMLLSFTHVV